MVYRTSRSPDFGFPTRSKVPLCLVKVKLAKQDNKSSIFFTNMKWLFCQIIPSERDICWRDWNNFWVFTDKSKQWPLVNRVGKTFLHLPFYTAGSKQISQRSSGSYKYALVVAAFPLISSSHYIISFLYPHILHQRGCMILLFIEGDPWRHVEVTCLRILSVTLLTSFLGTSRSLNDIRLHFPEAYSFHVREGKQRTMLSLCGYVTGGLPDSNSYVQSYFFNSI